MTSFLPGQNSRYLGKVFYQITGVLVVASLATAGQIQTAEAKRGLGLGVGLGVGLGAAMLLNNMNKSKGSKKHSGGNSKSRHVAKTPLYKDQKALATLGFYDGAPNGKKDQKTIDAILSFQSSKNITPTGIFTPVQRDLLHTEADYTASTAQLGNPDIGYASQRKQDKAVQSALKVLNHYSGRIDGSLGKGSKRSIRAYQLNIGKPATGILVGQDVTDLINTARNQISGRIVAINENWNQESSKVAVYSSPETVSSIKRVQPIERKQQEHQQSAVQFSRAAISTLPPVEPVNKNANVTRQKDIAVIIGNKKYKEGVPPVAYGHRDADAVKAMIINDLGFNEDNILDLRDAGQGAMRNYFGSESSHKGKIWRYADPEGQSSIFVYYSGHGAPEIKSRRAYLVPVDADPNSLDISGYPLSLMYSNLQKIPAKSITVMLDACFSGDSSNGMLIKSASPLVVGATPKIKASNFTVLSAANGNQLASWDDKEGHGIFTRHVLKGLKGAADKNSDKKITAGELHNYVLSVVRKDARRQHGRDQTPMLDGNKDIVIRENY